jgi:hypothetical protein
MDDVFLYRIEIREPVVAEDLLSFSPPGLTVAASSSGGSLLSVSTDQSGMIGLIRHLHGLGLFLRSICCEEIHTK